MTGRPHVGKPVKEMLLALGWEILPHPYSPDIAPSDYHLFWSMQNALSGAQSFEHLKKCENEWIILSHRNLLRFWNSQLPERWLKVIDNDGDYFDN
ncbi:Mariner Mos1 transposase [Acromyrmex echinatior]|uniref:Mariner Mos1 transposase n=1 Tax=Acromyrmex echinatior TaxID=103372 RepID=F4X218_ACREC|nr:Mariner Mos1 transposase [Acromyrmex echinatior]